MKTILIPTDFSAEALRIAESLVLASDTPLQLIFSHFFHVADDIQGLLFGTYRKRESDYIPDTFQRECDVLATLYPGKLCRIRREFYYGNTIASFRNFLDANQVDQIAYSSAYGIPRISRSSLDALMVIRKSGLELVDTDLLHHPDKQYYLLPK